MMYSIENCTLNRFYFALAFILQADVNCSELVIVLHLWKRKFSHQPIILYYSSQHPYAKIIVFPKKETSPAGCPPVCHRMPAGIIYYAHWHTLYGRVTTGHRRTVTLRRLPTTLFATNSSTRSAVFRNNSYRIFFFFFCTF